MAHQIWVGNIPYETTEEELKDVMSTVAPVVSVRYRNCGSSVNMTRHE